MTPSFINGARTFTATLVLLGAMYCTGSLLDARVAYPWAPWTILAIGSAGLIGVEVISSALSSALKRVAGFGLLGIATAGFAFAAGIAKYTLSWPGFLIAAAVYFGCVVFLSHVFNLRLDQHDRQPNGNASDLD